ncbi:MAG: InlB B-repeat-containing protein [Lachnospiraceae bacterium]|nr:InlB B-repeat-containing protein [Lachnospiraceae bacterium]
MQKRIRYFILTVVIVLLMIVCCPLLLKTVYAQSVYDSPFVTFSPDGQAFTTNAFDREVEWYEYGTVADTGVESSLRGLQKGEHYYRAARYGGLPVGEWRVEYKYSTCCHTSYPPAGVPYHGISFGRETCKASYYSGWVAYCADCNETLLPYYVYMSQEAAVTIKELDSALDYYYLCPFCSNLEQGVSLGKHWCKEISWNRYQVRYESNATDWVGGYMENSIHMYNNATIFEGREVTPIERLSKNMYTRIGYEFVGWNTEADGSGQSFTDREKILNLTDENYDEMGGGVVVLYAQWEKSAGLLKIDPAGGSYKGNAGITEIPGEYGASYLLDLSELTPPDGAKVSFQTNGGQSIASITGTMVFREWLLTDPFLGRFKDNVYYYTAGSGSIDTVTAQYDREAVILPATEKSGSSFGGWYYDSQCTVPAGGEGDRIIPQQNMTLYAKWVDLVLEAQDNYSANSGKGAVNLTWAQNDGRSKTYMIYQSTDNSNWILVSDSEDISNSNRVSRSFAYTGKEQTYVVPYTGLYTLRVNGAQGKGCGNYSGGYGGTVVGRVWLEKGEKLTYNIGSQDGYNGGGSATAFGNGGGCTTVASDLKGILIVAGGGGGATMIANGGAGGSVASNLSTGYDGESGGAGGGGGYRGGTAGQAIYHYHSEDCYVTKDTSYTVMSYPDYLCSWAQIHSQRNLCHSLYGSFYGQSKNIWGVGGHGKDYETAGMDVSIGEYFNEDWTSAKTYIPTEENSILNIHISADTGGGEGIFHDGSLIVYDQNERVIFYKTLSQVTRYTDVNGFDQSSINSFLQLFESRTGGRKGFSSGWYGYYNGFSSTDSSMIYWNETVTLPEGTTGVRIRMINEVGENQCWFSTTIEEISFSGSKTIKVCVYDEGQLVTARQSYGGSSYVNTEYVTDYTREAGKQAGNGFFSIESLKIGYQQELFLKGVKAPDKVSPDKVEEGKVTKCATGESCLSLSWEAPPDKGTEYYHRAESYLLGSAEVLSHSNVTKNTLISGVAGYYYLVNGTADTNVNSNNGRMIRENEVKIELTASKQYFHVAAVDKAGNIGATTHIEIGKSDEEVAWPVMTEVLRISSADHSIYQAGTDTYYVKCDGKTPFRLDFTGFILGQATPTYQVNHLMYCMQLGGAAAVTLDIVTPNVSVITDNMVITNATGVTKTLTGKSELKDDSYTITRRSNGCRRLTIEQRFTMDPSMNAKKMWVVPMAGADFEGEMITSDPDTDKTHGLWLIGDNAAPVIAGVEAMEKFDEKEVMNGKRTFTFQAIDEGSGVREFYAVVINSDTGSRKVYEATGSELVMAVDANDEVFQGDFITEFYAADRVGNERIVSYVSESLALSAYVERILEPHKPVFRCVESGSLNIITYGYPDKVEVIFPEEMSALDAQLNTVFVYDGLANRHEEEYIFMIPFRTPQGEWEITVKAWKDGKVISKAPIIWTLGEDETILDDLRTRLR